jgi:FkbM family methyltransferase
MTVIDLGAYAGISSMAFKNQVGMLGKVIAVEADPKNQVIAEINFKRHASYMNITCEQHAIQLVKAAIWYSKEPTPFITFSSESSLGSSAVSFVGEGRGTIESVPAISLIELARKYSLLQVDFIKCDVEGAEEIIFQDEEFFSAFKPRIIIEPHITGGRLNTMKVIESLLAHGYSCRTVPQRGSNYPLIQAEP